MLRSELLCLRVRLLQSSLILKSWTEHDAAWVKLEQGFWRLQRRTLARLFKDESFFALQTAEVLVLTQQLPLRLQAKCKRLGFAAKLAQHGGEAIWAILQWEQSWSKQLAEDLQWLCQWSAGTWPPVTPAAWPLWWHILTRPGWLKEKARQAARDCWRQESRDEAVCCFLLEEHRRRYGTRPCYVPLASQFCCPPCAKAFRTKSGLGAHFKKIHKRYAAYRSFGGGTICKACGKNYYDEHRLLTHLRHSTKCRSKLVAAGMQSEGPQGAITSWRKNHGANFILCPPQRESSPLRNLPAVDWQWQENPLLQQTHQKALDWLVWFDGATEQELTDGLLAIYKAATLYDDEFQ